MIRPFTTLKELTNGNFFVEFLDRQVVTSHLNSLNHCLTELSIRILLFVLLLFFFNVTIVLFYSTCACWILLPVLLLLLDIYSYLDGGCNAKYHIGHFCCSNEHRSHLLLHGCWSVLSLFRLKDWGLLITCMLWWKWFPVFIYLAQAL